VSKNVALGPGSSDLYATADHTIKSRKLNSMVIQRYHEVHQDTPAYERCFPTNRLGISFFRVRAT
jgi:hypothetical protein